MRVIHKILALQVSMLVMQTSANGQVMYPGYVAPSTLSPQLGTICANNPGCVNSGPIATNAAFNSILQPAPGSGTPYEAQFGYVNVLDYGNSIYNAANAYTTTALGQQLVLISASHDNAIRRQANFLSEGIAMASAIEILPPNPGDRFAVNIGGAGYNGQGAGSISGTVRVSDNVLGYVGYARSLNQNLVKGGFSVSIH